VIAVTVSLVVSPGDGPALEAAVAQLAQATLRHEPDVLRYSLCRSAEAPGRYRLIELYKNQAALDHHLATEWFLTAGPVIRTLLAEPAVLERYEVLD
jgi:quinol monooxygenase YgiN